VVGLPNKRALIVVLALLGCIVLISTSVTVWSLHSRRVERRMQVYIQGLQVNGFEVKEQSMTKINDYTQQEWNVFDEFKVFAQQQNVTTIYSDTELDCLYCLTNASSSNENLQVNFFICPLIGDL
jgi:hypothetical protein